MAFCRVRRPVHVETDVTCKLTAGHFFFFFFFFWGGGGEFPLSVFWCVILCFLPILCNIFLVIFCSTCSWRDPCVLESRRRVASFYSWRITSEIQCLKLASPFVPDSKVVLKELTINLTCVKNPLCKIYHGFSRMVLWINYSQCLFFNKKITLIRPN